MIRLGLANNAHNRLLIDPIDHRADRANAEREARSPHSLSAEPVLKDFVLDLAGLPE